MGGNERRRRWDRGWALAAGALAALTLAQIARALAGNLTRLHPPGVPGHGTGSLGDADSAATALRVWRDGRSALAPFEPWTGTSIVTLHTVLTVVAAVVTVAVALPLLARLPAAVASYAADGQRASLLVLLSWCRAGVAVWAVAAAVAATARAAIVRSTTPPSALTAVVRWSGVLGAVALGGTVVAVLLSLVSVDRGGPHLVRGIVRAPAAVRLLLASTVVFLLLLFSGSLGVQSEDLLRRWVEGHPGALATGLTGVAASVAAVVWAARLLPCDEPPVPPPTPRTLLLAGAVLTAAGAALWLALGNGIGVLVLGVGVLAVGLASAPIADRAPVRPAESGPWANGVGMAAAAALPAAGLCLVTARLLGTELITRPSAARWWLVLLAVVLGAAAVAGGVGAARNARRPPPTRAGRQVAAVAVVAAVVPGLAVWAGGLRLAWQLGSLGLVLAFLAQAAALLGATAWWIERRAVPAALAVVGFRRVPVVSLVVVWALVGGVLDRGSDFHDARRTTLAEPAPLARRALDRAAIAERFQEWLSMQPPRPGPVPLVLVTASGGGIRAAAWTTTVLDCVFGPTPSADRDVCPADAAGWRSTFAASGASGGSVGLATHVAASLAGADDADLDQDHLAASLAWQLFVEAPLTLPRLHVPADRAERLERSWSAAWPAVTDADGRRPCWAAPTTGTGGDGAVRPLDVPALALAALPAGCAATVPLLVLNGTNTPDGCRVNLGPVDAAPPHDGAAPSARDCPDPAPVGTSWGPSSHDVIDALCPGQDLPLVTAAFLSARFPIVSPAGRVPARVDGCASASNETLVVVDGGYRDNVGAGTLADLWDVLAPEVRRANESGRCVQPVWLDIDNGYEPAALAASGSSVFELLRPLEAVSTVFSSRSDDGVDAFGTALAGAGLRCAGADVPAERITVTLHEHPGLRLPLGWTLSDRSLDDLHRQLLVAENRAAIVHLRALLTGR